LLTRVLRNTDVKCRYGGDEFLIILVDTSLVGAQQAAESVRRKIAALPMVVDGKAIPVTVSVGVAEAGPTELGATGLIGRADDALYQAKREGRNRCRTALMPAAPPPAAAAATQLPTPAPPVVDLSGL
jgi:diguanylate cyclase (GGDEF)-like protein